MTHNFQKRYTLYSTFLNMFPFFTWYYAMQCSCFMNKKRYNMLYIMALRTIRTKCKSKRKFISGSKYLFQE